MSWDADLLDEHATPVGEWNYTHNTSGMIREALARLGAPVAHGEAWWQRLNGLSGPGGAAYLDGIIRQLEADPIHFEAMNPSNGWGSYAGLVAILTEMRNSVPEWPTTWSTSG